MRSHKKQLAKHRLLQNLSAEPNPSVPTIQWITTPKIPVGLPISQFQFAPTPPLHCEAAVPPRPHNSAKEIINSLIMENSELRKSVFRLQHEKSIMRLQMQNKELQYKNAIFQHRDLIDGLLQKLGYNGPEQYYLKNIDSQKKQKHNWQQRRSHLYQRFESLDSLPRSKSVAGTPVSRNLNKSISINLCKQKNSFNNEDPEMDEGQSSQLNGSNYFRLNQCDHLNFGDPQSLALQPVQHFKSLSSVTQVIYPNKPHNLVDIQQIPTINLQLKDKVTTNTSKAQTERIEKNSNHDKKDRKSSGRVSSQGVYSNDSFRKIVQKGMRNRQRIEKLLHHCTKLNIME